jgi:hypothetical protein
MKLLSDLDVDLVCAFPVQVEKDVVTFGDGLHSEPYNIVK